ncbi:heat shock 70 kDa protein II-like [Daphnia carinata]|uniref:heat shock 70 kDa protein II-like n=1 Tax=Daphnia carinata TaxID=120202 RepID=UPI00257A3C3E|nr:heat shock 70 kDa protein II-like [Daphnia carinata]
MTRRKPSPALDVVTHPTSSQSINGVRKSPRLAKRVKGKPLCIGIDLGTAYARVAVYRYGQAEIITNEQGNRTTSSCIAFGDAQRLIGDDVENQSAINPLNTVFDTKRLLGRQLKDVDQKHWPFDFVADGGKPKVEVNYKDERKAFYVEEMSAVILLKMKQIAEAHLGTEVTDAVITVPANFNDSQRQATRDAGTIAGFNVLRILNEPTAAAIAYGVEKKMEGEETVLIFDLGGGTFDVSVVTVGKFNTRRIISVKSTAGNTKLGGIDFDDRMVDHFAQEFYSKHQKDLMSDPKALYRLRLACDQAKRTLSYANQASIAIVALHDGIDFSSCITRVRFEYLCADLFQSTLDIVQKALNDAGMTKDMMDEIIVIGGSTRIPKIRKLLSDFFNRRELYSFEDSHEAVACGAAVQAAILHHDTSDAIQDLQISDIAPLSWDILIDDGVIKATSSIVKKNSKIPRHMQISVTRTSKSSNEFAMMVYEGEEPSAKGEYRREFNLTGLPLATFGVVKTDIIFEIDANGTLGITAMENTTGHLEKCAVKHDETRLSGEEIEKLVKDAAYQRDMDELWRERLLAKNSLESYCLKMIDAIENQKNVVAESEKKTLLDKCFETIKWIDDNHLANQEKFEEKLEDVKTVCHMMTSRLSENSEDEIEDSDYDASDIDSDDEEDDSDEDDSDEDEEESEDDGIAPLKKPKIEC